MSSHVGEKFKIVRSLLGLSQAKFCELLDIGLGGYKKTEIGTTEPGYSVIEKFANHPDTQMYVLWLLTDKTNPEAGQYAPGDHVIEDEALSNEQFEQQAIEALAQSQLMFCHLGWFKPNEDKLDEKLFDECGAISLNSIKPLISAKYGNESKTKTA